MADSILIIEDEEDISGTLAYNFGREGFQVTTADSGNAGLEALKSDPLPDLVLLDLMLPDVPGTDICRQIRQDDRTRNLPVVMMTAKGEEIDRVVGFELGADDYVVKPFSTRELLLRVKAILRRTTAQSVDPGEQEQIRFGVIRVDQSAHRVWVGDEEIKLTPLEFRLLTTFMSRKGRVQKRETLLHDVWGIHADVMTRTVDTHVKRLREKLGPGGDYIETLRGVGYRFQAVVNDETS